MVIWRSYNVREGGTSIDREVIEVVQSSAKIVRNIIDGGDNRRFRSILDLNT